jgi:hypothetical protein
MKDGTLPILYTKETREYARHVRYWRDVRGSQVSLFSCLSRMHHVTRVCATSGECQDQPVFVHVKRVTLRVITPRLSSLPAYCHPLETSESFLKNVYIFSIILLGCRMY